MRLPVVAVFLSIAACSAACAAELKSFVSQEGKTIILLDGEIVDGDSDTLTKIIRKSNDTHRLVSGLRLNSPGGKLVEGAKIADIVRYGKIATIVPNGAKCASACFLIFAAGVEKYASYHSDVGVHGAADETGEEAGSATISMARKARELGAPANIVGKMVVAPPSEIVWLTPNDLRSMGTTITGKITQAPPSTQASSEPPLQLDPSNAATASQEEQPTWEKLVSGAVALSKQQNGGQAKFVRGCQPEFKACTTGVYFRGKDGNDVLLKTTEDEKGNETSNEVCTFNSFGDTRVCVDWNTHATHRDMKDTAGNWTQVGAQ